MHLFKSGHCSIVVRNLGANPVDFTISAATFAVQYGAGGGVGAGGVPSLPLPTTPQSPDRGPMIYEDNDDLGLSPEGVGGGGGSNRGSPSHHSTNAGGGHEKGNHITSRSSTDLLLILPLSYFIAIMYSNPSLSSPMLSLIG